MINKDRIVKTFCEISEIDSPSGEEDIIAEKLINLLKGFGLNVFKDDYGNVIANDGRDNPIMLSAHMDTVEPSRGVVPVVDGDKIVSEGNTIVGADAKCGIAAILEALESVKEDNNVTHPIEVVFTKEEEIALLGARNLDFSKIKSKEALVFDSEGPPNRIVSMSPTYVSFDISVNGIGAHAGVEPEKGLSAILIGSHIMSKMPQGRLDPHTTFNVGLVDGGTVRNAVPEDIIIKGEFRTSDDKIITDLKSNIKYAVTSTKKEFPEALIDLHLNTDFETYSVDSEDSTFIKVEKAIGEIGLKPVLKDSGAGTDGNIFRKNGIKAVVVGMGANHMHTLDEYVNISDLFNAAKVCEKFILK